MIGRTAISLVGLVVLGACSVFTDLSELDRGTGGAQSPSTGAGATHRSEHRIHG